MEILRKGTTFPGSSSAHPDPPSGTRHPLAAKYMCPEERDEVGRVSRA